MKVAVQALVGPRFLESSRGQMTKGAIRQSAQLRYVVSKVWKLLHAMTSNLIRVSARDPTVTDAFADF
jgi:hypothetical protein